MKAAKQAFMAEAFDLFLQVSAAGQDQYISLQVYNDCSGGVYDRDDNELAYFDMSTTGLTQLQSLLTRMTKS